ncbi:MAG: hypothetical protein M0P39_12165 [Rhodocyclaceae bacterium]|jgi:hypothetical protein|nr:hypothetical protein [Rhodocyclaceae bacterium]
MRAIFRPFHSNLFTALCLAAAFLGAKPLPAAAREKTETASPIHAAAPADARMATDAVLRNGMEAISGSLGRRIEAIEKGRLAGQDYVELANQTEAQLSAIVKNCKLEPKADSTFHAILADMNHAVELMRGKKVELQRTGALALGQALRNYGKYFDHPGWGWPSAKQ